MTAFLSMVLLARYLAPKSEPKLATNPANGLAGNSLVSQTTLSARDIALISREIVPTPCSINGNWLVFAWKRSRASLTCSLILSAMKWKNPLIPELNAASDFSPDLSSEIKLQNLRSAVPFKSSELRQGQKEECFLGNYKSVKGEGVHSVRK